MLLLQHKPQYIVVNVVLLYNTFTRNEAFTSDITHSLKFQFKCNGVKSASVKTRVLLRRVQTGRRTGYKAITARFIKAKPEGHSLS